MPTDANNEQEQQLPLPQPNNNPWKIDREFWLREAAAWTWGSFRKYEVFVCVPFGRIRSKVGPGGLIQLNDARKKALLESGYLVWADENKITISAGLKALIEQAPTALTIRAFVRSEVGQLPAKEAMPKTSEEWLKFIDSVPAKPPPTRDPYRFGVQGGVTYFHAGTDGTTVNWATETPIEPVVEGYNVRVSARRTERGSCNFSVDESYRGEIRVPMDIMAEGANSIHRFILHELEENGDDYFDAHEDYEHYDYETTETGEVVLRDHGIHAVLEVYRRDVEANTAVQARLIDTQPTNTQIF